MTAQENYAQIFEGKVQNIIVGYNYPTADHVTKCTYGPEAFAVFCNQYGCSVGDKYHDGWFWRVDPETGEETQVPYVPTQEQQVAALTAENAELTLAMAEMIGGGADAQ